MGYNIRLTGINEMMGLNIKYVTSRLINELTVKRYDAYVLMMCHI